MSRFRTQPVPGDKSNFLLIILVPPPPRYIATKPGATITFQFSTSAVKALSGNGSNAKAAEAIAAAAGSLAQVPVMVAFMYLSSYEHMVSGWGAGRG